MWRKLKPKRKQAIKLFETFKDNGVRMYNMNEIADIVGVDKKTVARWISRYITKPKYTP